MDFINSKQKVLTFFLVIFILVSGGNVFAQKNAAKPPAYFTGAGGKGESVAVMPISGKGLSADEAHLPSLVQSVLVEAFNTYSAMEVLDRVNLEKIIKEGETDFYIEDNDIIRYGTLIASKYQLHGTIQKTSSGGFVMMLKAAEAKNAQQKATYNESFQVYEIENLSAARKAACDILPRMGVNLTDAGKKALLGPASDNQAQAQIMLAKGITANRQGTVIQAADYFYHAASLDPSLQEASNRAGVISSTIQSGDIGMDIRNEILWYNEWVKYVKDADAYFDANPPVEIIHGTELIESNLNSTAGTVDFSFYYIALPTQSGNVIKDLVQGLIKTKRNQQWKLNPYNAWKNIQIEAQLLNDKGEIIGRARDTISCDLNEVVSITRIKNKIIDSKLLTFKGVNVYKITNNLKIKITSSKNIAVSSVDKFSDLYTGDNELPFESYYINCEGLHLLGIKDGFKLKKDFIIPDKIGKWYVVGVGAFYKPDVDSFLGLGLSNLKSIKNIVLPSGLKYIYKEAFYGSGISGIVLPKSLISIGDSAFSWTGIKNLELPPNLRHIGKEAFSYTKITSINLPPNLATIGDSAFEMMFGGLKGTLIIPDSVTTIGNKAFGNTDNFSKIIIPANVSVVGNDTLYFEGVYNQNGKKAGTYVKKGWSWVMQ